MEFGVSSIDRPCDIHISCCCIPHAYTVKLRLIASQSPFENHIESYCSLRAEGEVAATAIVLNRKKAEMSGTVNVAFETTAR